MKLITAFTIAILALLYVPSANAETILQYCEANAKTLICIAATGSSAPCELSPEELSALLETKVTFPGGSFAVDVHDSSFVGGRIGAFKDSSSCSIAGNSFFPPDGVFLDDAEFRNWKSDLRLLSRDLSVAFECDWGANPAC